MSGVNHTGTIFPRGPIFNLRGTAAFRRQGDRSGLTRAQRPSEAQSNKLCDPSMGEQNLLAKAASFRGQWFTEVVVDPKVVVDWAFSGWDGGDLGHTWLISACKQEKRCK